LLTLLKSDARYLPAYITFSFTSQLLGSNEDALAYAERAIELSPNTAQARVAKANALLAMERDAEAVAALETAFGCDPKNAEIQIELGDVKWRNLNRPAEAFDHYKRAAQLNRVLLKAHLRMAELALDRADTNEAAAAVTMIRRLAPAEPSLAALESSLQKLRKP
jgi:tetratricopeptide (TPR) repeat protein